MMSNDKLGNNEIGAQIDRNNGGQNMKDSDNATPMALEMFLAMLSGKAYDVAEAPVDDSDVTPFLKNGDCLRCSRGSACGELNVPGGAMPCKDDCVTGSGGNIKNFGLCSSASGTPSGADSSEVSENPPARCPCTPVIVGGKWMNTRVCADSSGSFDAPTHDSFLVCIHGGLIEPEYDISQEDG